MCAMPTQKIHAISTVSAKTTDAVYSCHLRLIQRLQKNSLDKMAEAIPTNYPNSNISSQTRRLRLTSHKTKETRKHSKSISKDSQKI